MQQTMMGDLMRMDTKIKHFITSKLRQFSQFFRTKKRITPKIQNLVNSVNFSTGKEGHSKNSKLSQFSQFFKAKKRVTPKNQNSVNSVKILGQKDSHPQKSSFSQFSQNSGAKRESLPKIIIQSIQSKFWCKNRDTLKNYHSVNSVKILGQKESHPKKSSFSQFSQNSGVKTETP